MNIEDSSRKRSYIPKTDLSFSKRTLFTFHLRPVLKKQKQNAVDDYIGITFSDTIAAQRDIVSTLFIQKRVTKYDNAFCDFFLV